MSLFVVDSSVLIDHLRGDERAIDRLKRALESGDDLWSLTVVRFEILAGARAGEEGLIDELFGELRWLDVSIQIADAAGRLAATHRRAHPEVDTVDYLLAAGAMELGAEILTQNVRHFPMYPGLRPAY